MFKELRNEAIYHFLIKTESPFVIKSGNEDILDPSLPDGQVLRAFRNGKHEVVIPGSTLKGLFRSRAEQLMKTLGHKVNTFRFVKADKDDSGEVIYNQKSDVIQRLFGSTALKGRIIFSDAYPLEGTEVVTGLRHGVKINRITGGVDGKQKFDTEVVEEAIFRIEVKLVNFELWQLALVAWLIQDLHEGFIKIGSATTRGFGRFSVRETMLSVHDYRNLPDQYLHGYQPEDCIGINKPWTSRMLKKTITFSSLEELIGPEGVFLDIRFPEVSSA